jgi:hypothetical protein
LCSVAGRVETFCHIFMVSKGVIAALARIGAQGVLQLLLGLGEFHDPAKVSGNQNVRFVMCIETMGFKPVVEYN